MKKPLYLFLLVSLTFISCSKTEVDLRDDYVGTWNETAVGSMSLSQNGSAFTTTPINVAKPNISITKTGTNQLIIDGDTAIVSGTKLIIDSSTQTQNESGLTMTVTADYAGTLSKTIITVTETYSGNWDMSGMMSGEIGGSTVYTFTKSTK